MLKAKSKFEIHEHDNFFVWLLKGNPKEQDPQKVMNDYLKGFFKDVAHRKGFAEFILKRPDGSKEDFSHINTNPNEFKKFLETYQSDFIGGVNWQNQLENLRKFEERVGFKLPTRENFGTFIDTVEPTIVPVVNAFKTVLKSNANFTDTQWEKIQLQNPQLKREEAENVWRLAILQMMMVTNNSLAGINPGEGIPLALFGADLKVELIHLPKPAIILITPFNIEVSQQKGDGLVKNLITPENGSRPDLSADKNTIVPFLLYDTRISIQDFNVFSKSNHTVVTHYSNLRMAPHAVNFLENMALALTTDASDPKRKLAKPAPTPDPVKDRYRGLPSFVADFDIIQKKVDLSLAAETVLEQAAAQDTYVPIGSVEEREIAVQWLNLKPTLNAFVEELELLWPKFKPYCIQTPEGLQIKPEYLPRVGEDPGIPYETLMELERFLPILNAYPVAKIGLLKKIGTQFTQDSSISTYAEIRTNYISRASAAKIPLEIQFNSANPKEIIPTNTQLTLASECARDFFKGGVAFETRAAQEFYGRIVQFALVGDPTFKTLDPVLEGFSTVELRAAPAVTLEVYRHTSFLDWYIQEVNPKTRASLAKELDVKQPESKNLQQLNRKCLESFISTFFTDIVRLSYFKCTVGKEDFEYDIFNNCEIFHAFLIAYQKDFEEWLSENPAHIQQAKVQLKALEDLLGVELTNQITMDMIQQVAGQITVDDKVFFNSILGSIYEISETIVANTNPPDGLTGDELVRLCNAHLLQMLVFAQQKTAMFHAGELDRRKARY